MLRIRYPVINILFILLAFYSNHEVQILLLNSTAYFTLLEGYMISRFSKSRYFSSLPFDTTIKEMLNEIG